MKLKYKYTFQKYEDKYLAIVDFLEEDKEKKLIWVNECGKIIMELLHDDMSKEDLIFQLNKKYTGDSDMINKAVDDFTNKLKEADLLI